MPTVQKMTQDSLQGRGIRLTPADHAVIKTIDKIYQGLETRFTEADFRKKVVEAVAQDQQSFKITNAMGQSETQPISAEALASCQTRVMTSASDRLISRSNRSGEDGAVEMVLEDHELHEILAAEHQPKKTIAGTLAALVFGGIGGGDRGNARTRSRMDIDHYRFFCLDLSDRHHLGRC